MSSLCSGKYVVMNMKHGNGANPSMPELLLVAKEIGIDKGKAEKIAKNIHECVHEQLREYI